MTTTNGRGPRPSGAASGAERARRTVPHGEPGGRPPEPHPLLARLDSPLSTYYLLLGVIGLLLGIGIVMVLSASSVASYRDHQDSFKVGLQHAEYAVIGLVGAFVASRLPVPAWKRLALPMLGLAVLFELMIFVPGLGVTFQGNTNWLRLGFLQFQPSEFGKLALVLYGATILATKRRLLGQWRHALIPLVFPAGACLIGLVLLGGDLGTTIVLLGILTGVLWTSGVSARLFGVAAAGASALVVLMAVVRPSRMERIASWRACADLAATVEQCWQAKNGQFALADGGLGGLGLGASREKWTWLPEPTNDFIFAIIGEELGIGGTLTILLLICLLAFACYRVILQSDDAFVRMTTAGVMAWVVVQSVVNIGAVLGLLPVIGVPLPLISAGGTALITTLFGLGIVVSFARAEPACARALAERPGVVSRSLSVVAAPRRKDR